jgi:AcrR family transcriptional regulator
VGEFKRTGVADADVGAIVDRAGVAHGTFFFHFPTKEHVVAELGQREEVRMAAELERFLSSPHDLNATLLEFLRLVRAMERRIGPVLFRDLLALYFSPTRPELRLWPDHPLIARLISEFELAYERGEIGHEVDPAHSAMFFLLGLYALLITHEKNVARVGVLEQYVITIFRGLDPR